MKVPYFAIFKDSQKKQKKRVLAFNKKKRVEKSKVQILFRHTVYLGKN